MSSGFEKPRKRIATAKPGKSSRCPHGISRRSWLLSISGLSLLGAAEPQNISYPLQAVAGTVTPANLFFVRNHFTDPDLSLSTWRLKIEGRVARPLEMTFPDILESPTRKVEAILECAGNAASGSAVSNGNWEGVPLLHLLEKGQPLAGAAYVLLEGADAGRLLGGSPRLPYSRLVPLSKCLEPESLVAFKLNDSLLPHRNGFPARALLPGWYGMDAVKWLQRVVVLAAGDKPDGLLESGMDQMYVRLVKTPSGRRTAARVSEILVKSVIAYPGDSARLPAGGHLVWGFAWTGTSSIRKVEVSTDEGRTWNDATLESSPRKLTWVRWSYSWAAQPGEHILMSRASDRAGHEQPIQRDPAREDGYELNYCAPVHCSVR